MASDINNNTNNAVYNISRENLKANLQNIEVGDTVKVNVRIVEGKDKTRLQAFTGVVIAQKSEGIAKTITVRRVNQGYAVERVFPVHSPIVDSILIEKKAKVRRSKLYYLRDKVGKSARLKARD